MSGHEWKQDEGDNLHPEENLLLAYIRRQLAADTSYEVYQHLGICEPCRHQHTTLLLQSGLAYSMSTYPSVVDMLGERIDSPTAARLALQQRRRSALQQDIVLGRVFVLFFLLKVLKVLKVLRLQRQNAKRPASTTIAIRSVPLVGIAVLIISILLVVAIVLAYTLSNHILVQGNFYSGSQLATPSVMQTQIAIQSKPTATPTATPTQAGNTFGPGSAVTVTPTATPTGPTMPYVKVCSTPAEFAQSQLYICGANFKPGDKIVLYEIVPGIGSKQRSMVFADAHGSFSIVWTITSCHTVPGAIFAQDQTTGHRYMTPTVAVTVAIGSCHGPNTKP